MYMSQTTTLNLEKDVSSCHLDNTTLIKFDTFRKNRIYFEVMKTHFGNIISHYSCEMHFKKEMEF